MKNEQAKIIMNCAELLKSTLGRMPSMEADKVVKAVSEILEAVAANISQSI